MDKKSITRKKIISVIGFILLFALYVLNETGSKVASASQEMFVLGGHTFPLSTLAGVFSSMSTVIFICWVVFYRRLGFYTSISLLIFRIIRLSVIIVNFNAIFLPAIFVSLVSLLAVVVIYNRNNTIQKTQDNYKKGVEEFTKEIIGAFASCIDGKDTYTNGHSRRVARYTRLLAQKLGETNENIEKFYNIALLHDIGKIGIPESILQKPGRLTDEEFNIMKSHAKRGYEILKDVTIQEDLAAGAHYHHERIDGKGYPDGLSGSDIPWVARIISVADAFDAMSSTRPYREKLPLDFIVQEIQKCAGTQFDPTVANAFLELYEQGTFDYLK